MKMTRTSIIVIIPLWYVATTCAAFFIPSGRILPTTHHHGTARSVTQKQQQQQQQQLSPQIPHPRGQVAVVSMGLFRDLFKKMNGEGGNANSDDDGVNIESNNDDVASTNDEETANDASASAPNAPPQKTEKETASRTPFFVYPYLNNLMEKNSTEKTSDNDTIQPTAKEKNSEPVPVLEMKKKKEKEILSPMAQAESLRAQAARIRLEADKRQVELTLEKIAKLEMKLERLKRKENNNDANDRKSLEEELLRLKSQLSTLDEENEVGGGAVKTITSPLSSAAQKSKPSTLTNNNDTTASSSPSSLLSSSELEERVKRFQDAPEFMQLLVAKIVGLDNGSGSSSSIDRLNATEIIQKIYDDEMKYSKSDFRNKSEEQKAREMIERAYKNSRDANAGDEDDDDDYDDMPIFTEEQIQAKVQELEEIPKFLKNMVVANETELAKMLLEDEWIDKNKNKKKNTGGLFGLFRGATDREKGEIGRDGERMDIGGTRGAFRRMFPDESSLLNGTSYGQPRSDVDFMMNSLYPQSTRKEGQTPEKRLVDAFLNDIVAPTRAFTPSDNPLPVNGGWIIRGKNECNSGDELIDKLDRRVANDARLREKISFFILKDPFPNPEEQMLDPLNWPQVLFVAGPNVARDPEPILRTAISAFGIATAWYGSIYPFLVNPKLLDRATEAMELADAGMPTDLSWLSEMSIPLFLSFMALQLLHEIAHQIVAKSRNFEATIPTLVPSVMSGITSSITSLKTPPKNKQDLVDFAVAGPLTGMIGSILVLCYGLALTATADASMVQTFPGIPLVILRQSSLGGGLIDIFLGNGVLNVPSSAEGAQALASTLISLHPFAVAGFFALVVNALALVPAGRTDGGRISMALFGRSGCQAVTFASLASLFILGITQSDLLLFYFAFIAFFQSELEIPMRNEVDDVGFSSVLLASFAGFLMLLTLIPM